MASLNNLGYNIKTILALLDWGGRNIQTKTSDNSYNDKVGIVGELKHLNRGKAANQPLLSTLWAARLLSTRSGKHLILFANIIQIISYHYIIIILLLYISILYFVIIIRPCLNSKRVLQICSSLLASPVGRISAWQCWKSRGSLSIPAGSFALLFFTIL